MLQPATSSFPPQFVLIASRLLGAVGLGYVFCAACVGSAGLGLIALGWPRSEAVVMVSMLGFVLYLGVLLWAFSVRSLWRLWAWLGAGSVAIGAALWWIQAT